MSEPKYYTIKLAENELRELSELLQSKIETDKNDDWRDGRLHWYLVHPWRERPASLDIRSIVPGN